MRKTKCKAQSKTAELDRMIEEAMADCYDEDEAFCGMVCTLQNKLKFPFEANVLGKPVKVIGINERRSSPMAGITAVMISGGKRHRISLSSLRLADVSTKKWKHNEKWMEAFLRWAGCVG